MSEALDCVVIQIDVRHFAIRGKRIGIDREPMILRSDFNAPSREVFDRLIAAVMPEGQFVSSASECKSHQLVA